VVGHVEVVHDLVKSEGHGERLVWKPNRHGWQLGLGGHIALAARQKQPLLIRGLASMACVRPAKPARIMQARIQVPYCITGSKSQQR
jgi:hypothetical protein